MRRHISIFIILWAVIACSGQDASVSENTVPTREITDSTGSTLEQRIKLHASQKNDSSYVGRPMPRLKALNENGDTIDQNALSRVVFYNFWFTGCAPCIAETPYFNVLAAEYEGRVDFIAITFEELQNLPEFFEKHPFNFTHYTMGRSEINKLDLAQGYPTTIVAVEGEIISWKAGGTTPSHPSFKEEMEKQNDRYRELFKKNLK